MFFSRLKIDNRFKDKVSDKRPVFNSKLHRYIVAGFFAGLLIISSVIVSPAQQVGAATKTSTLDTLSQAQSFAYYKAMHVCLFNNAMYSRVAFPVVHDEDRVPQTQASSYEWFSSQRTPGLTSNDVKVGMVNDSSDGDGVMNCGGDEGKKWIKKALALWGYSNGPDFLCNVLDFRRDAGSQDACTRIGTGNNDFIRRDIGYTIEKLSTWWLNTMGNSSVNIDSIGGDNKGGAYTLYLNSFFTKCANQDSPISDGEYTIKVFKPGSTAATDERYTAQNRDYTRTSGDVVLYESGNGGTTKHCDELEALINGEANSYSRYLLQHEGRDTPVQSRECLDNPDSCPDANTLGCGLEGIGWIVCPALDFMADVTDGAYDLIVGLLQIETGLVARNDATTGTANTTFSAWGIMRNIANVAFVLVFLIIIFSQLTSLGVTNYGVKKMLPRLVIAAILVNLSYYVCQAAVDLSNIIGGSVKGLFDNLAPGGTGSSGTVAEGVGVTVLVAAGVTAVVGVVAGGAVAVIVPVLVGALVSVVVILVILVLRKALVVLLIVIAPLAFVAYLLPNTEPLFKKWRQAFTAMLVLYPIVGAVFGASALAAAILKPAGEAIGSDPLQWTAIGAATLPFLVVPALLKKSMDGIGGIGTALNSLGNRVGGGLSKKAGEAVGNAEQNSRLAQFRNYRKGERDKRRALMQSGEYEGKGGKWNPRNLRSNLNRAFNESKVSGKFGDRSAASGIQIAKEAEDKDVQARTALMRRRIAAGATSAESELGAALRANDIVRARAAQDLLYEGGSSGVKAARRTLISAGAGADAKVMQAIRENMTTKHGQLLKGKDAAQIKWATDPNAGKAWGRTLEQHVDEVETWAMSASDLSTQTGEALITAATAGNINPELAFEMLSDDRVMVNLDDDQKAALKIASGGTKQSAAEKKVEYEKRRAEAKIAATKRDQDAALASYTVSAGGPIARIIPEPIARITPSGKKRAAQNAAVDTYLNPSARREAEARAASAAAGTTGTDSIVVDSEGVAAPNTPAARRAEVELGTASSGDDIFRVNGAGDATGPTAFSVDINGATPQPGPYSDASQAPPSVIDVNVRNPNPADIKFSGASPDQTQNTDRGPDKNPNE